MMADVVMEDTARKAYRSLNSLFPKLDPRYLQVSLTYINSFHYALDH